MCKPSANPPVACGPCRAGTAAEGWALNGDVGRGERSCAVAAAVAGAGGVGGRAPFGGDVTSACVGPPM